MSAMATDPPSVRRTLTAIATEPFTRRARAELLYLVVAAPTGIAVPVGALAFLIVMGFLGPGPAKPENVSFAGLAAGALVLLVLAPRLARRLGSFHRRLTARLLGERVAEPPSFRPGQGVLGRLDARLRDGAGWRAVAYLLLRVPVAVLGLYAVEYWGTGLVNLSYPFWWGLFRNHPPDVHLSPVPFLTPLRSHPFHITTYPGTLLVFAAGAASLLVAPWVTRAVVLADRWLIRNLLGPGRLMQRVRDLEQTRAQAVDDSAALLRRLERDLHDGAQARLAALAMNLGLAKEKLGDDGLGQLAQIRELVEAAHQGAKDALGELRDLARGIHPPILDTGLSDALATLAVGSAIPVEVTTEIPSRPTPAIETIAYFCAAELLANAVKHSHANTITIHVAEPNGCLLLVVTDDGVGGADPARGTGLSGLAHRVGTVDGQMDIASPPGGPTRVSIRLPPHA
ncbi:sensor domain-containing protein [Actinoallomurus sp. NBC_01490]|uniref:sensor histidine kinase n=1 Tax=Actinoallomurus sp. NBC_01490 TaxID=2903557 RepID=UPI002E345DFE|nr:sensor domain-containing protein [Actinoallomurus sp. NBC_01490]